MCAQSIYHRLDDWQICWDKDNHYSRFNRLAPYSKQRELVRWMLVRITMTSRRGEGRFLVMQYEIEMRLRHISAARIQVCYHCL
jgi:hypothetical protein